MWVILAENSHNAIKNSRNWARLLCVCVGGWIIESKDQRNLLCMFAWSHSATWLANLCELRSVALIHWGMMTTILWFAQSIKMEFGRSWHRLAADFMDWADQSPVAMGVMRVGREKERLSFLFGPSKKIMAELKVFFRIPAHSGLFVSSVGRDAEAAPIGSMFSNHRGEVSAFQQ